MAHSVSAPPLKIVDKALVILSKFTEGAQEWGTTELALEANLPKSTVYRVLRALVQHEYLAQDPVTRRYRLGLGALQLGWRAHAGLQLGQVARPVLNRIVAASGETALLLSLNQERDRVVCLERAQRDSRLKLILDVGSTAPLHAGSSSKVLLAFMSVTEIEDVIRGDLQSLTSRTITDANRLREELATIRGSGYALSFEETDLGAAGVSVPIWSPDRRVVAGLTIAEPISHVNKSSMLRLIELARRGAREIASELN